MCVCSSFCNYPINNIINVMINKRMNQRKDDVWYRQDKWCPVCLKKRVSIMYFGRSKRDKEYECSYCKNIFTKKEIERVN